MPRKIWYFRNVHDKPEIAGDDGRLWICQCRKVLISVMQIGQQFIGFYNICISVIYGSKVDLLP